MFAIGAAVISGVANYANGMVVRGIDPLVHNVVKNGLVGVAMLVILLVTAEWRTLGKLKPKQWRNLGLVALIGGSIPFWLFFTGVKQIGGVEGSMIHKSLIFWVALMAIPLLKERVGLKMWAAIGLLYLSNMAAGFTGFKTLGIAHLMVLSATMFWAVENILVKKTLTGVPVNVVVTARMLGGAVILAGILVASGKAPLVSQLTTSQWWMLMGVALLLFGYVSTWYRALQLAPVTVVAGILVGATVVTTMLEAVLRTKTVSLGAVVQGTMMITGIYLVVTAVKDWKALGDRATTFWKPKIS
ncbi:hypothetical protein A2W24_00090 [Microgenomates group bacterium RBG_16_45_19]|nr:MAG: hypothetical protein A2W24_00090 [Microgenomates group bacterium RBG_16_45_19]